jgi:two-component system sensor histidine kinase HydH
MDRTHGRNRGRISIPWASKGMKFGIILASILGITVFHYVAGLSPLNHQIYGKFYYVPVVLGAVWFGTRGGFLTSFGVSLLLIPHLFVDMGANRSSLWGTFLEIPILNLVGLISGYLRDREKTVVSGVKTTYAFVAHEMKNIAISISGFANLIYKRGNLSGEASKFLGVIEMEAQRIERLSKGAFDFSKEIILKKETMNADEFLMEIVLISEGMALERGVQFRSEAPDALPAIGLDPDAMKAALINLTHNALHATPPGGVVTLKALKNGETLKIQVADSGHGIPADQLNKIFQPFYTTRSDGFGLGLAVTKRIIEAHGGTIEVESVVGKGSRFTVSLALGPEEQRRRYHGAYTSGKC